MVIILMLSGVAAAFVMRPWQHDRESNATIGGPGITSHPPSAVELPDTAQCGTATSTSTSRLTGITSGRHDTFDRILLGSPAQSQNAPPDMCFRSWRTGPASRSPWMANAFLRVTLRGAAAHDDAGKTTYSSPPPWTRRN
jgi:hypothetical protein